MSRFSEAVISQLKENREKEELRTSEIVKNFMGGDSYKLNPLQTLEMIAASSILGEPSYYRESDFTVVENLFDFKYCDDFFKNNFGFCDGKTTNEIFEKAIDNALSYDFPGTLNLADKLRNVYNMRMNPQIIMVRAAIHPCRKEFTEVYKGMFQMINNGCVMKRADDPLIQLAYYLYLNKGSKKNLPSILKRSIAAKLSNLTAYSVNKYKNHEIGMINAVRITHANSPVINELMKNGNVEVDSSEITWEQKRSSGMTWREIVLSTNMGHMALLRNIRNVFIEDGDYQFCMDYCRRLKSGVLEGKQFPFRYYSAYKAIEYSEIFHYKNLILDTLEECIDISVSNLPKLKGRTMCLTDNSGSAFNTISYKSSTTIAEIDNLSSVIAAYCSDEGYVGKFGNTVIEIPVSKRNGILSQCNKICSPTYEVGKETEGGIWEFFSKAIKKKDFYDNIFIFSDQQAGTGGLYGDIGGDIDFSSGNLYRNYNFINVYKMILEYRKKVNPKVNVFSVQTAGYENALIPSMSYRCAMLTGWTGKEILFAKEYIDKWDELENK